MVCVWQRPIIHPVTLVVISTLVTVMATPVYLVIGYLIDSILLAPTSEEVMEQLHHVHTRRKSAVHLANRQQEEALSATPNQNEEAVGNPPRPKLFRTFSKIDEVVLERQKTMQQSMRQSAFLDNLNAEVSKHEKRFDSFTNLKTDLGTHSSWLVGRKHKEFLAQWPIDNEQAMTALEEELNEVQKASEDWKKTLKQAPPAAQGIRLLQLFVQDLIGRKSRQSQVFGNHLEEQQLEEKMVMSLGAKALAMATIVLMNLYFVFSCMLYGRTNGESDSVFLHISFSISRHLTLPLSLSTNLMTPC